MEPDDVDKIVQEHFRVYETREERFMPQLSARMFFVMFPQDEFDSRYHAVKEAIHDLDPELLVFMRREGGEDILYVAPRPPVPKRTNRVNIVLLLLTLATTITAGAISWHGYRHISRGAEWSWSILWSPEHLLYGTLAFALPLMLILGIHEAAHFVAAKRHGLRATLPFFIPFPPLALPIGTLGAFISIKDPMPDRKALFDVGASGPIAGFIIAVPVVIIGAFLTNNIAEPVPDMDRPHIEADAGLLAAGEESGVATLGFNDSSDQTVSFWITAPEDADEWHYTMDVEITLQNESLITESGGGTLDGGETVGRTLELPPETASVEVVIAWDDGLIDFGDPLLVKALEPFFDNGDYLTHPTFFAGWVGLLVTGINLLPAGQLDGGHVARAVLGERQRFASYAAIGMLMLLALQFGSWILMALFILFMGLHHPPPLNDRTELGVGRKALAWGVLAILALTFVARPVIF